MYRIAIYFSIITLLADPGYAFECGVFPSEGRPKIKASGKPMILRRAPMLQAGLLKPIIPARGTLIQFEKVRFRTVISGLYLAQEAGAGAIQGTVFGRVSYVTREDERGMRNYRTLHFAKGDTLEYLQAESEGFAYWRIGGLVISKDGFRPHTISLKELRRPQFELWIQVVDKHDEPLGWYLLEYEKYHPQPIKEKYRPEWRDTEFLPAAETE